MKKTIILFVVFLNVFFVVFYVITKGQGSCKLCGSMGKSKTLEKAIERNTFIKKLTPVVIKNNDSIEVELNESVVFFIEKGFRYGEHNTGSIVFLEDDSRFKYQLSIQNIGDRNMFKQQYRTFSKEINFYSNKFIEIPDTIKRKIVTLSPPYDSIYEVGELLLFDP